MEATLKHARLTWHPILLQVVQLRAHGVQKGNLLLVSTSRLHAEKGFQVCILAFS